VKGPAWIAIGIAIGVGVGVAIGVALAAISRNRKPPDEPPP
jgi:hypothetical protein